MMMKCIRFQVSKQATADYFFIPTFPRITHLVQTELQLNFFMQSTLQIQQLFIIKELYLFFFNL